MRKLDSSSKLGLLAMGNSRFFVGMFASIVGK